jgi:hypothetical protein
MGGRLRLSVRNWLGEIEQLKVNPPSQKHASQGLAPLDNQIAMYM